MGLLNSFPEDCISLHSNYQCMRMAVSRQPQKENIFRNFFNWMSKMLLNVVLFCISLIMCKAGFCCRLDYFQSITTSFCHMTVQCPRVGIAYFPAPVSSFAQWNVSGWRHLKYKSYACMIGLGLFCFCGLPREEYAMSSLWSKANMELHELELNLAFSV